MLVTQIAGFVGHYTAVHRLAQAKRRNTPAVANERGPASRGT
jgi:hypothetical protein